jgi:hypothetical protein
MNFWMQRVFSDPAMQEDISAEVIKFLGDLEVKLQQLREKFNG